MMAFFLPFFFPFLVLGTNRKLLFPYAALVQNVEIKNSAVATAQCTPTSWDHLHFLP